VIIAVGITVAAVIRVPAAILLVTIRTFAVRYVFSLFSSSLFSCSLFCTSLPLIPTTVTLSCLSFGSRKPLKSWESHR